MSESAKVACLENYDIDLGKMITSDVEVMRHAIALNGSFFNTHRMIQQYAPNACFL